MRTGAEYRESRRDGRQVWLLGEKIDDVTRHPATAPVVDAYAQWYDWHHDPAWQDVLLTPPDARGERPPIAFEIPRTPQDIRALGESVHALAFPHAGYITHTPGYGAVIFLAVMDTICSFGPAERGQAARAYWDWLAREQVHLVAPFATPSTDRARPPAEQLAPRVVKETDGGVVVSGSLGMATSMCYADVAYVGVLRPAGLPEQAIWCAIPVNAPGVKIFARKPAARVDDPFLYPLSTRYDELDCGFRMDDVFVPWEHVFLYRDVEFFNRFGFRNLNWLQYFHLARMLAWADFSLGLALAVTELQTTAAAQESVDALTDLIFHVETQRTAFRAAAFDAEYSPLGHAMPGQMDVTVGMTYALQHRAEIAHTVRLLAGHQAMLAPALEDLAAAELGAAIAPGYESAGVSARQRAALMHLIADHTTSALEGRQIAFEGLATGGLRTWRLKARTLFQRQADLVNGVLAVLDAADRPDVAVKPFAPR
ncbi:MAG TPA: 4-hydroxyphenylacetate 3-hydroxylase N-terminal domain-containing protein [Chloroflexota bacterium]|jgi:4-hydroxyphenylacetate 3-monooxygenase